MATYSSKFAKARVKYKASCSLRVFGGKTQFAVNFNKREERKKTYSATMTIKNDDKWHNIHMTYSTFVEALSSFSTCFL